MGGLTREALAERAGVHVGYVDRLLELGILAAPKTGSLFTGGDVRRVRLVRGLEEGGLPLEGMGTAVRKGDLSFGFLDLASWEWYGGFIGKTYRELSAETGLGLELLQVIRESMGFARPEPEDPVHEEALDLVPVVKIALEAGADPVAIERLVRVWGESMRRITEASATFYRGQIEVPLLRSGLSEAQVLQAANEAVAAGIPYIDRALASMYHGQSEHTWMANVVEAVEATLEKAGLHHTVAELPAMCFLDLSGYTQLTEERGDEAAAEMAAVLGGLVQRSANDQRGRPVKWLGDGVMLYFAEPDGAVISALELAERVPAAGLPPPHTGIDAGPVIFQDGDYFGRTVNTAARIASHGGPGQVLVSDSVVRLSQNPAIRFVDIGLVELKGLPHPIRLHRASRLVGAKQESSVPH
ncbi:MAG TPA: adenylate cyclase regulatory domain-containing protein [Actinomycetota bacterium]|nr:adenylate cyclase regulatory domain-containing protein [Actinomycetota bacterium]